MLYSQAHGLPAASGRSKARLPWTYSCQQMLWSEPENSVFWSEDEVLLTD